MFNLQGYRHDWLGKANDRDRWKTIHGICAAALLLMLCSIRVQAADLDLEYVLPDPQLTPGVATLMSVEDICAKRWGLDRRYVTAAMKRRVFEEYGLTGNDDDTRCHLDQHGRRYEIDHLVSRELGGADHVMNLWPQCYSGPYNAIMKDRLENRLHKEICTGHITLDDAQEQIRTDWRVPYRRYFEERN